MQSEIGKSTKVENASFSDVKSLKKVMEATMKNIAPMFAIPLLAVLLLSGCASPEATSQNEAGSPADSAGTSAQSDAQGNIGKSIGIESASPFYQGYATVVDSNGNGYVIDKDGNILSDDGSTSMLFFDGIGSKDDSVIDVHGNILASPEKTGYTSLVTNYVEGYAVAYCYTDAYPSAKIEVGVLDSEGNWLHPLSSDNALIQGLNQLAVNSNIDSWGENSMNVFTGKGQSAYVKTAKPYFAAFPEQNCIGDHAPLSAIEPNANLYMIYAGNNIWYVVYTSNAAVDNVIYFEYDSVANTASSIMEGSTKELVMTRGVTPYAPDLIFVDENNDVVSNGAYTFRTLKSDANTMFYTVEDGSGQQLFDPMKLDSSECIYVDDGGFVLKTKSGYERHALDGTLITTYSDVTDMQPFYDGLALVQGTDYNWRYIDMDGNTVIE